MFDKKRILIEKNIIVIKILCFLFFYKIKNHNTKPLITNITDSDLLINIEKNVKIINSLFFLKLFKKIKKNGITRIA